MKKENIIPGWLFILIVIVVILIIYIIYTISLGKIDLTPHDEDGDNIEEKKLQAAIRHLKLQELIDKKVQLKKKLDKRFRLAYLSLRIFIVVAWVGINVLLYYRFNVQTMGELLNWNELFLIGFFAINFVCYGTITSLKTVICYFKNRIENWVYGRYVTLNEQIEMHKRESNEIEKDLFSN